MGEYLSTTTSTCVACGRLIQARVHLADGRVWLRKECPEHGYQEAMTSSETGWYLDAGRFHRQGSIPLGFSTVADGGCPASCGLCPEHEQHICMPIIEITDHCDMECPICLVHNRSSFHLSPEEVAGILDGLIESEGRIDVVNLSGGEPTLNPHFREIVKECLDREEILRVSVSTNGRRLLSEPALFEFLAERDVVISLQFDGFRDEVYVALRGAPLLDEKLRLIDRVCRLNAPMSLTATVAAGINDREPTPILDLLFERDSILSVMFQPAAYTGRAGEGRRPPHPTTIPDILHMLDGARSGQVHAADFSPLPCSHPACFALAFYLRTEGGEFVPVKHLVDVEKYLDIIQNRSLFGTDEENFQKIQDALYDLWSGPAGATPDSQGALRAVRRLLEAATSDGCYRPGKAVATAERSIKSVFVHQFMDRGSFDLSRARKCCTVYALSDGRSIPACVRNCIGAL